MFQLYLELDERKFLKPRNEISDGTGRLSGSNYINSPLCPDLPSVLVKVSIAFVKHNDKNLLERKEFMQFVIHRPEKSGQEHEVGTWRHELMLRPQMSAAH